MSLGKTRYDRGIMDKCRKKKMVNVYGKWKHFKAARKMFVDEDYWRKEIKGGG